MKHIKITMLISGYLLIIGLIFIYKDKNTIINEDVKAITPVSSTEEVPEYKATDSYLIDIGINPSIEPVISTDTEITAQEDDITTETILTPLVYDTNTLDVECIMQNPELPTGCEVTSLAIVLKYYNYDIDKLTLAEEYLDKGDVGTVTAWQSFIGSPTTNSGYGCYSPVLIRCAEKYLDEQTDKLSVTDLTGTNLEDLFYEIDKGNPVIVWATINLVEPITTDSWVIDGKDFSWLANEHCLVLTGYDKIQNIVYVADPLKGNTTYDLELFKDRYNKLFRQAIVLRRI